jgi:hypothetical protein
MELDSFRELLAKKAQDTSLQNLVKFVRNDVLADMVIESLEKMARAKHKGNAANLAIRDFGVEMDQETEPEMIREAIGHHVSRYKAALKKLNENKDNKDARDMLNKHAEHVFKLVNMVEKTQKHTNGKLRITAPSPHAWERNVKQKTFGPEDGPVKRGNKKVGQFVNDTKGWNYQGYGSDHKFEHLQHSPHEHYEKETKRTGYSGAFPFEKIQINGKYIHVDDDLDYDKEINKEHFFNDHPIMSHYNSFSKSKKDTQEQHEQRLKSHFESYRNRYDKWHDGPHIDSFFDRQEKYGDSRSGQNASDPVHTGESLFTHFFPEYAKGQAEGPKESSVDKQAEASKKLKAEVAAIQGKK